MATSDHFDRPTITLNAFRRGIGAVFGLGLILGLWPPRCTADPPEKAQYPPGGYTIYVAPHSHIDLVWYWTYDKTQSMSIKILQQAMKMLKEDPRYTFTQDQLLALKPFWDELSEADRDFLRRMVREGRFELTTGMYV